MWGRTARTALETALAVKADQSKHEAVCTERWNELRHSVNGMAEAIKRLFWMFITCGAALIIGMATLIVTLTVRH